MFLAYTNRQLGLHKEGILQARESLEICERINHTPGQAHSLRCLAWSLRSDEQLDAAGGAASRAIGLFADLGEQFEVCQGYHVLGIICHHKGKIEEAISHFGTALGIATSFDWHSQKFWNNYSLAELFFDEERFDGAHVHVEPAKSHAVNDAFLLGRGMQLQASFWQKRRKFEEAKSEVLRAADVFEKLGAALDLEKCRELLRGIQKEMDNAVVNHESDGDSKFLTTVLFPTAINPWVILRSNPRMMTPTPTSTHPSSPSIISRCVHPSPGSQGVGIL